MSIISSTLDTALADRLRAERRARNWSMRDLAARSGVSKAMIGRIEKAETSPTANLLVKIANALGLTLSTLLARTEQDQGAFIPRDDQPVWIDPDSHYIRRSVSAVGARGPDMTEVTLPAHTQVHFEDQCSALSNQQILVLEGELVFDGPQKLFPLSAGDWLQVPETGPRTFANRRSIPCRYLLVSE